MSLLDTFKKKLGKKQDEKLEEVSEKKETISTVSEKKTEKKTDKKTEKKEVDAKKKIDDIAVSKTDTQMIKEDKTSATNVSAIAHRVLLNPVVSEKSAHLNSFHQYVFKVARDANKIEIKQAIKELYKVEPISVRVIHVSGKSITRGRVTGTTSAYKKAIVRMPKGVELPIYEGV